MYRIKGNLKHLRKHLQNRRSCR